MSILPTNTKNVGVKRNSYYDVSPHVSQRDQDIHRISEGYSKEPSIKFSDVVLNIKKENESQLNKNLDIFQYVSYIHKHYFQNQRAGQLMGNFVKWIDLEYGRDIFYLEDEKFIELFDKFTEKFKEKTFINKI